MARRPRFKGGRSRVVGSDVTVKPTVETPEIESVEVDDPVFKREVSPVVTEPTPISEPTIPETTPIEPVKILGPKVVDVQLKGILQPKGPLEAPDIGYDPGLLTGGSSITTLQDAREAKRGIVHQTQLSEARIEDANDWIASVPNRIREANDLLGTVRSDRTKYEGYDDWFLEQMDMSYNDWVAQQEKYIDDLGQSMKDSNLYVSGLEDRIKSLELGDQNIDKWITDTTLVQERQFTVEKLAGVRLEPALGLGVDAPRWSLTITDPKTGIRRTEYFDSQEDLHRYRESLFEVQDQDVSYSIGIPDPTTGEMRIETFSTEEAAHRYAEVYRTIPLEQQLQQDALRRLLTGNVLVESDAQGYALALSPSGLKQSQINDLNTLGMGVGFAEVSTELAKPYTRRINVSDEGMEDLLMRGQLERGQIVNAFRTNDFNVSIVIQPTDAPTRDIFRSWSKTAFNWHTQANELLDDTGFYTTPPRERTPEQIRAGTEYRKLKLGGSILNVIGSGLNPLTYLLLIGSVGKGAVALATDPVGTVSGANKALAVSRTRIKKDYNHDPIGFATTVFGSIVGNIVLSYGMGKTWSTIKPAVVKGTKSVLGGLKNTATKLPGQIDDLLFKPYLDDEWAAFQRTELAQRHLKGLKISEAGKIERIEAIKDMWSRAIPDEFILGTPDIYTPGVPSFMGPEFIKGLPRTSSLWDEFRAWASLRGRHTRFYPAIPDETILQHTDLVNDVKMFMKHRGEFIANLSLPEFSEVIGTTIKGGRTSVNLWDEAISFYKAKGWITRDAVKDVLNLSPTIFDKAKIYWMLKNAERIKNPIAEEWVTALTPEEIARLNLAKLHTPWYKTGQGMGDMPWPSKGEQLGALELFGVAIDDVAYSEALEFFIGMEKAGVGNQVTMFANSIASSGVPKSVADSLISNYTMALTALYMAKTAITREVAESALKDAISSIMGMSQIDSTPTTMKLMYGALYDIENRMKLGIISNQFQGFDTLSLDTLRVREILDREGIITSSEIQKLYEGLLLDSGLALTEVKKIDPIETTLIKSDIKLGIGEIPFEAFVPIPPTPLEEPPILDVKQLQAQRQKLLEAGRLTGVGVTRQPLGKRLSPKEKARRRRANRILPSRKTEPYRVVFKYPDGASDTEEVDALTFQQAYNVANRRRKTKLFPLEVEVEKL